MQCGLDARHHARRHALEALRPTHVFDYLTQQPLGVIALAEEAPVKRFEPFSSLGVRQKRQPGQAGVHPAVRPEDGGERLVGVQPEVQEQKRRQQRNRRQYDPAGQRILQALPQYYANVEQPVA